MLLNIERVSMNTKQAAECLGFSATWVTQHAEELDGGKEKGEYHFDREKIERLGKALRGCMGADVAARELGLPRHRLKKLLVQLGAFQLVADGRWFFPKQRVQQLKEAMDALLHTRTTGR